jgi:hypothetical protein
MPKKLKLSWAINPEITLHTDNYNYAHNKRLEFPKNQIKTLTEPKPIEKKFKKGLTNALTKEEEKLRKNPNRTKTRIQIEARIKREQKAQVMGLAARNN